MWKKEIQIPKVLHELHGESTRLSTLVLVYLTGLIAALLFVWQLLPAKLALWQYVLLGIIVLDIAGGVVANLSSSTNQYYQKNRSIRMVFLLLHVLQPVGLYLVFPQYLSFFVFLTLFTLLASFGVNALRDTEHQQNLAGALLVLGICGSLWFDLEHNMLYLIAPLYMIKLILGFSVKRPSFTSQE
jgi:hypothetical protein